MKKLFLEPEMEVIKFGTEDIITTSPPTGGGSEEGWGDGGVGEGFPEGLANSWAE